MAFVGAAVVKSINDNLVRITGVSLDSSAAGTRSGTIGLFEKAVAPDVRLPDNFEPTTFSRPDEASEVSLQDSVEVTVVRQGGQLMTIAVVKTGTKKSDFQIEVFTLINLETGGTSGDLEIYVRFH